MQPSNYPTVTHENLEVVVTVDYYPRVKQQQSTRYYFNALLKRL